MTTHTRRPHDTSARSASRRDARGLFARRSDRERHDTKNEEPNDDRLTADPEPQQIRGTSQDFEQFSNGFVQIEMNRPRKDGGPENADAWQALERVDDRTKCASWEEACRSSAKERQRSALSRFQERAAAGNRRRWEFRLGLRADAIDTVGASRAELPPQTAQRKGESKEKAVLRGLTQEFNECGLPDAVVERLLTEEVRGFMESDPLVGLAARAYLSLARWLPKLGMAAFLSRSNSR